MSNAISENTFFPKQTRLSLFAGFFCVGATGIGFGLSLPLLSFVMKSMGLSPFLIGLNTAMPAVAALVLSPLFVKFMEKWGIGTFIFVSLILTLSCLWGFTFTSNIALWFFLRFLFGAGLDAIFVASETWVGELCNDKIRGRVMGLFSSCLSCGYAIGASILSITGSKGLWPFISGSLFLLLVIIPLTLSKKSIPNIKGEESGGLWPVMVATPIAMGSAIVYGYLETSAFNLLPIYGVFNNLSENYATFLLTIVGIGQACLQYFVGYISDKYGSRNALFVCCFVGIFGIAGLAFFLHTPFVLYPLIFLWGACISGFYTLALTIVGQKFRGSQLAAANSAVVSMFGLGSLIGPPIVGIAMDLFTKQGFVFALILPVLIYFMVLFYYRNKEVNVKN
ncbi:MAG: MFS transporter [Silvanigrellaceae bacterium]|nr:MFS transporter [Silvanigrellaceae bacterium]